MQPALMFSELVKNCFRTDSGTKDRDGDQIGGTFHRWVRDNAQRVQVGEGRQK